MTLKTTLAALAFTLLPGIATAACWGAKQETASTCSESQTWDAASQSCIAPVSS
ncbi:hypothetical protein [Roseicitreum antarcticum]|uniref:Chitin binding Peritrophin-A domain-containing protein n=1 Tax=Roseicitreum antarcticum TaxID=564137 RepID=A0A1H2W5J0_9RHOB|nr:hypothetical protein [Roseicitreum antarcticum]SDW75818.1 hypothetical protein SAMN04488238_103274 [Roseicitreum antarcticum]